MNEIVIENLMRLWLMLTYDSSFSNEILQKSGENVSEESIPDNVISNVSFSHNLLIFEEKLDKYKQVYIKFKTNCSQNDIKSNVVYPYMKSPLVYLLVKVRKMF